jgi:transposase
MPRRDPRCKLGDHRLFNLILWVLYTGMQGKCLPVPKDGDGQAEIHYTTVYKAFARWSDNGSMEHTCITSVKHLAHYQQLDLSVLHGDGTHTVAKKGGVCVGGQIQAIVATVRAHPAAPLCDEIDGLHSDQCASFLRDLKLATTSTCARRSTALQYSAYHPA